MDLKNKTVMVVGTGISGIGAVDLLNKVGADCILYDGNEKDGIGKRNIVHLLDLIRII